MAGGGEVMGREPVLGAGTGQVGRRKPSKLNSAVCTPQRAWSLRTDAGRKVDCQGGAGPAQQKPPELRARAEQDRG